MKTIEIQNQQVLRILQSGKTLTQADIAKMSINRLSARIYELRRQGYMIKSTLEVGRNKYGQKVRYSRYKMSAINPEL